MKLIRNYEDVQNFIAHLFDRLQLFNLSSIAVKFLTIKVKVKRDRSAKLITRLSTIESANISASTSIVKLITKLSTIEFANISTSTSIASYLIISNTAISQVLFVTSKFLALSALSIDALIRKSSRLLTNKWIWIWRDD